MIKVSYDAEDNAVIVELAGNVDAAQMKQGLAESEKLLMQTKKGFKLLADLTSVDTMDLEVQREIIKAMELFNVQGVGEIIRVIPDPDLDIAFNVMSTAHYSKRVQVHTVRSRQEAQARLREHEVEK